MVITSSSKFIQTTILKATKKNENVSPEKHIKALIAKSFADNSVEEIIRTLKQRTEKKCWPTVLKTMIVFHRLFHEADPQFMNEMKNRGREIFLSCKLNNITHQFYGAFILKYARYLAEKCNVFSALEFQFEVSPNSIFSSKILEERLEIISYLQSQLNGLLNCKIKIYQQVQPVIQQAYNLLGNDIVVLFSLLKKGLQPLLKQFRLMSKTNASLFLSIYTLYVKEITAFDSFLQYASEYMDNIPVIIPPSEASIEEMQKFVDNLTEDPPKIKNSQKRTLMKKKVSSPDIRNKKDNSNQTVASHPSSRSQEYPESINPFISLQVTPQHPKTISRVQDKDYCPNHSPLNISPQVSPQQTPDQSPSFTRVSPAPIKTTSIEISKSPAPNFQYGCSLFTYPIVGGPLIFIDRPISGGVTHPEHPSHPPNPFI